MTFVALWSPVPPTGVGADRERETPERGTTDHDASATVPPSNERFDALCDALLGVVPHVVVAPRADEVLVWADARGLSARRIARHALQVARQMGLEGSRVGVARIAIVAEVAARSGARREMMAAAASRPAAPRGSGRAPGAPPATPLTAVASGYERRFLAAHPLAVLPTALPAARSATSEVRRTLAAFADVGLESCGDLARLTREAVEVRFGPEGLALWRLARADDPRTIFRHPPRALPAASLEWEEYALRDAARLVFVANRLVGRVCDELRGRGEAARAMTLALALVGGGVVERPVRAARGTADRAAWLRLVRGALERIVLADAVRGLALRVDALHEAEAPQGDLFDRGFQTGAAAETAIARLVEDGGGAPVHARLSAHALPEQRARWQAVDFREVAGAVRRAPVPSAPRQSHGSDASTAGGERSEAADGAAPGGEPAEPLALRLLPEPRPIVVTTRERRGHTAPVRYRERLADGARARDGVPLIEIVTAAGPDRIAIGHETGLPVAREYWQCLTGDGRLVLLFRDASRDDAEDDAARGGGEDTRDVWCLHGWWD